MQEVGRLKSEESFQSQFTGGKEPFFIFTTQKERFSESSWKYYNKYL